MGANRDILNQIEILHLVLMAVAVTMTAVTMAAVVTVMVLAVATATATATVMTVAVAAVAAGVKRQPSTQLGTGMTKAGDGHEHNSRRQRTTRVQGG